MAYLGAKQTVFTGKITSATATTLGVVTGCLGASAIIVAFRGGDTANNLSAIAATCYRNSSSSAGAGFPLTHNPATMGKVNGDANSSALHQFVNMIVDAASSFPMILPIPTDAVGLVAQMATGDTNNVIVEAWPLFDDVPRRAIPGNDLTLA